MFDFLNKLTHEHHPPKPPQPAQAPEVEHQFINSSSASEDEQPSSFRGELSSVVVPSK